MSVIKTKDGDRAIDGSFTPSNMSERYDWTGRDPLQPKQYVVPKWDMEDLRRWHEKIAATFGTFKVERVDHVTDAGTLIHGALKLTGYSGTFII